MAVTYMTEEGFRKLKEELAYMESVQRPEISRQIAEARDKGDLSENAEYEAAKNEQAFVEGRIKELEMILANARIIEADAASAKQGTVQLGSRVTLKIDDDDPESYVIVGAAEANPVLGKISNESPLGRAIINASTNTEVEVSAPDGKMKVKILKVE